MSFCFLRPECTQTVFVRKVEDYHTAGISVENYTASYPYKERRSLVEKNLSLISGAGIFNMKTSSTFMDTCPVSCSPTTYILAKGENESLAVSEQ